MPSGYLHKNSYQKVAEAVTLRFNYETLEPLGYSSEANRVSSIFQPKKVRVRIRAGAVHGITPAQFEIIKEDYTLEEGEGGVWHVVLNHKNRRRYFIKHMQTIAGEWKGLGSYSNFSFVVLPDRPIVFAACSRECSFKSALSNRYEGFLRVARHEVVNAPQIIAQTEKLIAKYTVEK